ncbi:hypothetical protein N7520_009809 [Penicillium odoratum]|uniref:uncharacterized protein n=1 Tax=Penicillium odoratum TaxID=1167516 RepID=UPI0025497AF3|nr:uncharacterized protein N7520_009809 [Penicillium odoratum]KAJ5752892.1 hypothetical protein N7520_009809 [Penicillium odoratum]
MPPRKKTKRAHSTTPPAEAAQSSADTPGSTESVEKPEADYDILTDPWTDEQETALLKAIIKWKPVEFLHSQGYGPTTAEHLSIPGIWKKLGTLYNLEALNERVSKPSPNLGISLLIELFNQEDSVITDMNEDEDGVSERYCPFELPYDEYGDLMFERRLATEGSSSPVMSRHADSRRGSTVADTDEPRSSPAPSRGRKSTRGTRQTAPKTRSTRLHVEIGTGSHEKLSESDLDSGEETPVNDDDEEEGEEGSDEKESEDEEEGDDEKEGSRSTRAQTSRTKQKDKKPSTSTGTRRTGRRR